MISVKRHELKYYINNIEYHNIVDRLKNVLKYDKHSSYKKGYFIRSLYFDSYDDECLYQKLSGLYHRKKYRIRIYDIKDEIAKFEIKNKFNNQIFKETSFIKKTTVNDIIDGNMEALLQYNDLTLNKIYSTFKKKRFTPKVLIDYHREAFVFDHFNVRITIDKELRSNCSMLDIYGDRQKMLPVFFDDIMILEIKFDGYLPDFIKNMIQIENFQQCAISKYAMGRKYKKINKWEDQ